MSCKRELQRQLGSRYSYERLLSDREIQRMKNHIPADFSETAAAVLAAGCLRLNAVLYRSCKELLLGYPRATNASGGQSMTEPAEATTAQEINHAVRQAKALKSVRTG